MRLQYHSASFDLLGVEPKPSPAREALLAEREKVLGIAFPPSLREWYALPGSEKILLECSNRDPAVPLEKLGTDQEVRHRVIRFQVENQGVAAWYVRLDGSANPSVVVQSEYYEILDEESGVAPGEDTSEEEDYWPTTGWRPAAEQFSQYIYDLVVRHAGLSDQRPLVARLKRAGASAVRFNESGRIDEVRFDVPHLPGNEALGVLKGFQTLRRLDLGHNEITDEGVRQLKGIPGLEKLNLEGTQATPQIIDELRHRRGGALSIEP
jgi:hypothetical protein